MPYGRLAIGGLLLALGVLVAVAVTQGGAGRAADPNAPNVLVILTDDQRAESMEIMPATREFFEMGTTFSSAWATTPQCCPSRASFLSGKYAHNHGVLSNADKEEFDPEEAWPHILDEAGYATGYFGKYLNGWDPREPVPDFDRSFIGFDRDYSKSAVNSSEFATSRTMRFIRAAEAEPAPWAAVLALRAPHAPRIYPARYENTELPRWQKSPAVKERDFDDKNPDLASAQKAGVRHGEVRAGQLRMLAAADDALAKLYEMLEAQGELDNTLVVFTSDNGYYWGEHRLTGKALPYLGSLSVPMLARGPGFASGESDELVANIDLAPTILDVTGLEADYEVDGESLRSNGRRPWLMLEGPANIANEDSPVWLSGYLSARTHYFQWADRTHEYYDLKDDPFELENEVARPPYPAAFKQVRRDLRAALDCAGASCP